MNYEAHIISQFLNFLQFIKCVVYKIISAYCVSANIKKCIYIFHHTDFLQFLNHHFHSNNVNHPIIVYMVLNRRFMSYRKRKNFTKKTYTLCTESFILFRQNRRCVFKILKPKKPQVVTNNKYNFSPRDTRVQLFDDQRKLSKTKCCL